MNTYCDLEFLMSEKESHDFIYDDNDDEKITNHNKPTKIINPF